MSNKLLKLSLLFTVMLIGSYATLHAEHDKVKQHLRWQPQWKHVNNTLEKKIYNLAYTIRYENQITSLTSYKVGLSTRGSSPRSIFTQPDKKGFPIKLEQAEFSSMFQDKQFTIGIMKNPIFLTSDFLWDNDLFPLGGNLKTYYSLPQNITGALQVGYFEIEQNQRGPFANSLFYIQSIFAKKLSEKSNLKGAVGYINFVDVKNKPLEFSPGSNTRTGDRHTFGYHPLLFNGSYSNTNKLIRHTDRLDLSAEFVYNPAVNNHNLGISLGASTGSRSLTYHGDWKATVYYRRLEKDAWLDLYPDDSAYNGRTDVKGWEFIYTSVINEHIRWHIDLYEMQTITGPVEPYHYVQIKVDFLF